MASPAELDALQSELLDQQAYLLEQLKAETKSLRSLLLAKEDKYFGYNMLDLDPSVAISFSPEEADQLVHEIAKGGDTVSLLMQKYVAIRRQGKLADEAVSDKLADLRLRMQDIDNRLTLTLGARKIATSVLPAYTSNRSSRGQRELDASSLWRKWSGNHNPPAGVVDTAPPRGGRLGEYLSIPFKPAVWASRAAAAAPAAPKSASLGYEDEEEDEEVLSVAQFLRLGTPWFPALPLDEVLEEVLGRDEVVQALDEEVSHLTIIRSGCVQVTAEGTVLMLRRGDMFGYHDTAFPSKHTYTTMMTTSLLTIPLLHLAEHLATLSYPAEGLVAEEHTRFRDTARIHTSLLYTSREGRVRDLLRTSSVVQQFISRLLSLCTTEVVLEEVVDEVLVSVKDILVVDRISLYVLDTAKASMRLFTPTAPTATGSGSGPTASSLGSQMPSGSQMPLKGVAAHVATTEEVVNVLDCYGCDFFDATHDMRTGYRSRAMLCAPITLSKGQVIGVLQVINPAQRPGFGIADEQLLQLTCQLLAPMVQAARIRDLVKCTPSCTSSGVLQVKLTSATLFRDHRHVKYTLHYLSSGSSVAVTKVSPLTGTGGISGQPHTIGWSVDYPIRCCDLTPASVCVLSACSKNNHPIGWCVIPVFVNNYRTGGLRDYALIPGEMPQSWAACLLAANGHQPVDMEGEGLSKSAAIGHCAGVVTVDHLLTAETIYYAMDPVVPYTSNASAPSDEDSEDVDVLPALLAYCTVRGMSDTQTRRLLICLRGLPTDSAPGTPSEVADSMRDFCTTHLEGLVAAAPCLLSALVVLVTQNTSEEVLIRRVAKCLHSSSVEILHLLPVSGTWMHPRALAIVSQALASLPESVQVLLVHQLLLLYLSLPSSENALLHYFLRAVSLFPHTIGLEVYWRVLSLLQADAWRYGKLCYLLKDVQASLQALPLEGDGSTSTVMAQLAAGGDLLNHLLEVHRALAADPHQLVDRIRDQLPNAPNTITMALPLAGDYYEATHISAMTPCNLLPHALTVTFSPNSGEGLQLVFSPLPALPRHVLYVEMCKAMDAVLTTAGVDLMVGYLDIYPLQEACMLTAVPEAVSLHSLIQSSLTPTGPTPTPKRGFFRSNSTSEVLKRVPEDLITAHFLSLEGTKGGNMEDMLSTFWTSLAAYLLTAHMLALCGLTSQQILLSPQGVLGTYYPYEVLGLDDALLVTEGPIKSM